VSVLCRFGLATAQWADNAPESDFSDAASRHPPQPSSCRPAYRLHAVAVAATGRT
jgi:hypothetical protein